ncbi:MAG: hypothetical protein Barrevirus22_3 [Barrevirus sp.]|uniref:HNH endonuclease n=1 Tax=Barrevirus sp. TaxID=2487763 RepID=A0A3G4ZQS3_9VIRU|nr:MAG: hypothetical protein Barrevirus22_3 [Barrevirus sp.]
MTKKVQFQGLKLKAATKKVQSQTTRDKAKARNQDIKRRLEENPDLEKCKGIMESHEQCNKYPVEGDLYCEVHEYFKTLTDKQKQDIIDQLVKICSNCTKFNFAETKLCENCLKEKAEYREKAQKTKEVKPKCEWFDCHSDPCRNYPIGDTKFCKTHQYVTKYTDEMKENSELCKGCNKIRYLGDGCPICIERAKQNRQKTKEATKDDPKCPAIVGDHVCGNTIFKDGHCGKHKLLVWKLKAEEDGTKKVCAGYLRGCDEILDIDYKFASCLACLNKNAYSGAKSKAVTGNRNYEFNISKEFYYDLTKQPCDYCGEMNEKGWNGADRVINEIGYEDDNSVPCCTICNFMKSDYSVAEFVKHCYNIIENYASHEFFDEDTIVHHDTYAGYLSRQHLANRKVDITEEEFNELLLRKCLYCNSTNLTNQIGIDKTVSEIHYISSNVVPCCYICNRMKNKFKLEDFIRKVALVSSRYLITGEKVEKVEKVEKLII